MSAVPWISTVGGYSLVTFFTGMNGKIKFEKAGPAGQESGQSIPGIYLIKIENGKVVLPSV